MFRDISWLLVRALFKAVGVWFADFNLYSGSVERWEDKQQEKERRGSEKRLNVLRNNFSIHSLFAGRRRMRGDLTLRSSASSGVRRERKEIYLHFIFTFIGWHNIWILLVVHLLRLTQRHRNFLFNRQIARTLFVIWFFIVCRAHFQHNDDANNHTD